MVLCAVLLPVWTVPAIDGPPTVTAVHIAEAPSIDGLLDDGCWLGDPQLTDFVVAGTTGPPADVQTRAWLAFDDDFAYIGIECDEPRMDMLLARHTDHDAPSYQDDCVELFFQFDDECYYWFAVNTIGGHCDGRYSIARGSATPDAQKWDAHFVSAARSTDDGWTMEIAIPWAVFHMSTDTDTWRFNIARERWGAVREWTSWTGVFHSPAGFGRLELPGFDPSAHTYELKRLDFGTPAAGDNAALVTVSGTVNGIAATDLRRQGSVTPRDGVPQWDKAPHAGGYGSFSSILGELAAPVFFHLPLEAQGQHAAHIAFTMPDGRLALLRSTYFTAPEVFTVRPDAPIYYTTERPSASVQVGLGSVTVRSARVSITVDGPTSGAAGATQMSTQPHTVPITIDALTPGRYTLEAELSFSLNGKTERIRRAGAFRVIQSPFD